MAHGGAPFAFQREGGGAVIGFTVGGGLARSSGTGHGGGGG